jgi:SAM-dependent methyltransferase
MSHGHAADDDEIHFTQEFWDDRYRTADHHLWSGQPNHQLVTQVDGLAPGEALDAGCGEGADAIWLASRGWTVTGADISAVALERAAEHAAAQGSEIAERISWQRQDLLVWEPPADRFDLVSAHYIHVPGDRLTSLHRRLAAAIRPGGTLLIVAHHPDDLHVNVGRTEAVNLFPSPEKLAAALDPGAWEIVVASAIERPAKDLDGQPVMVKDTVLRARRR